LCKIGKKKRLKLAKQIPDLHKAGFTLTRVHVREPVKDYSKHKFACTPATAVHNNTGSVQVWVTLKYEQFLCTVPLRHEGHQKILTSIITSLLWHT